MTRTLALGLVLAMAIPGSALQNPAATTPPLVIQVGVDLIQIDATVTDSKGRLIRDLRAEDFTLEVDGKTQPITNAVFFERRPRTVAGAPKVAPPDPVVQPGTRASVVEGPSTLVFVVDDLNLSAASMDLAKQSLNAFVKGWSRFHTRAGLRTTGDDAMTFSLYVTPERFAGAIQSLKYNIRSIQGATSTRTVQNDANITSRLSAAEEEDLVARSPRALAQFEERLSHLAATINTLRGVPGRKAVVFISEGWTLGLRARDRLDFDTPLLSFYDDSDVEGALRSLVEVATRASVVLYTVDPRGLASHEPTALDGMNITQVSAVTGARRLAHLENQRTLQQLAEETGGLSTVNTNSLEDGLIGVLRDQESYYLIGFEPPEKAFTKSSGKPKLHKIKLSVNRENVKVRTRVGFYGVTDEDLAKPKP